MSRDSSDLEGSGQSGLARCVDSVTLSLEGRLGERWGSSIEAPVVILLAWIHATTANAIAETAPLVEFVQPRLIADIMCDSEPKCPVLAMYLHGDTIFLDDRLDVQKNEFHTSILLHELVHYVQQQSGRFREADCDSWVKEEREAFRIQTAWLRERTFFSPQRHQGPRREHLCADGPPTAPGHSGHKLSANRG